MRRGGCLWVSMAMGGGCHGDRAGDKDARGEGEGIPTLPLRVLGITLGSPVSAWRENSGVTGGWGEDPRPPFLGCWWHRGITQGSPAS